MAPERGALRLTRVALFALTAVGLASAAHLAAGGRVSPLAVLFSVPAVMIVINLLASAQRGYLSLFIAMAFTQVGLHLAFMAEEITHTCHLVGGSTMAGMPGSAAPGSTGPGSTGPGSAVLHCSQGIGHGMQHAGAAGGLLPSSTMLLSHLLAVVVLVAMLTHAESALWALAGWLGFRILVATPVLWVPVDARLQVRPADTFQPRASVPRRGVRRRGPPGFACAAP